MSELPCWPGVYESVHPLAVVQREGLIYLVCMFANYEDVRTIALHRIVNTEVLYESARRKPDFDIDAYITSGQFGVIAGTPITLRAVFTRAAGEDLYETPLSTDQVLTVDADGGLRLVPTVPNTARWCGGCSAPVTVWSLKSPPFCGRNSPPLPSGWRLPMVSRQQP